MRRGRLAVGRDSSRPDRLEVTWADLVEIRADDRVLLVDPGHRRSEAALRGRAGRVTVMTPGDRHPSSGPWDVVCVDDVTLRRAEWQALLADLATGGQVVQVCDNALSPLRVRDRWSGRAHGAAAVRGLGALTRPWAGQLTTHQVFGLLRSSMSPVTAFDVLSASGTATTVSMSLSHVGGLRGTALRLLARVHPALVVRLVPAWLVIAAPVPGPRTGEERIIGKIGNRDSSEIKIVRGDPPVEVERQSVIPPRRAELAVLRELTDVGFGYAPRVLGTTPRGVRYSWVEGQPLVPSQLDDDQLVTWTGRAARVLADLQELTRRSDGTVVVHGDFWLGNLLVRGEEVVGLIDWHDARRGSPDVDRRFLPVSYQRFHESDRRLHERLEAECGKVLPFVAGVDPALCLLGAGVVDMRPGVTATRFAEDPAPGAEADLVRRVLDWAVQQPAPPVLLATSRSAALAIAAHRDVLRDSVRSAVPDEDLVRGVTDDVSLRVLLSEHGLAASNPVPGGAPVGRGVEESHSYHAYADSEGDVVAHFGLRSRTGTTAAEVTGGPEMLGFGRRVVESLGLSGPVSIDLCVDAGGLRVRGIQPWLDPRQGAGIAAGVDTVGVLYADLAGLPRPRGRSPDVRQSPGRPHHPIGLMVRPGPGTPAQVVGQPGRRVMTAHRQARQPEQVLSAGDPAVEERVRRGVPRLADGVADERVVMAERVGEQVDGGLGEVLELGPGG